MGRGLALQFKTAFQDNWEAYARACEAGQVQPGRMFVYDRHRLDNPRLIINFPTKRHWRDRSRIEDIDTGLIDLVRLIRERRFRIHRTPKIWRGPLRSGGSTSSGAQYSPGRQGWGKSVAPDSARRYRGRASRTGSVFRPEHSDTAHIPGRHSTIVQRTAMDPSPLRQMTPPRS